MDINKNSYWKFKGIPIKSVKKDSYDFDHYVKTVVGYKHYIGSDMMSVGKYYDDVQKRRKKL